MTTDTAKPDKRSLEPGLCKRCIHGCSHDAERLYQKMLGRWGAGQYVVSYQ